MLSRYLKKQITPVMWVLVLTTGMHFLWIPRATFAQPFSLGLPQPGARVFLSSSFYPVNLYGLKLDPVNPFHLTFIVDGGEQELTKTDLYRETEELIKYFLTCLTIPDEKFWVNLSPHEENRIIPDSLGKTAVGRELLMQDYFLKQITASLMYPEEQIGKEFWGRVYQKAFERYGTTQLPFETFNKIWIVPEKATLYQTESAVIVGATKLKVMLERDYFAMQQEKARQADFKENENNSYDTRGFTYSLEQAPEDPQDIVISILREVIIPAIEEEVNNGKNFAKLRQIFHALALAAWFKRNLKNSFLYSIYSDQEKLEGIMIDDKNATEKIYSLYVKAFEKGVYDYIKVEHDPFLERHIPRKYFSGGFFASHPDEWLEQKDFAMGAERMHEAMNPFFAKVNLMPKKKEAIYDKGNKLGWLRKYIFPAVFSVVLSVSASFNGASAATNEVVGLYGHRFETAQDGSRYVVVREPWAEGANKARYTYSGLASDVLTNAKELGVDIEEDAKIYWDIIEHLAFYNHAKGPDYIMKEGDTIRIPAQIQSMRTDSTAFGQRQIAQKKEESSSFVLNERKILSSDSESNKSVSLDDQEFIAVQLQQAQPQQQEKSKKMQAEEDRDSVYFEQVENLKQKDINNIDYEVLYAQAQEEIQKINGTIDSLAFEMQQAHLSNVYDIQKIESLQQKIEELQRQQSGLKWSFARKIETELVVNENERYFIAKPGDLIIAAKGRNKISDFMIQGRLRYNGNLRYGRQQQQGDLQKQLYFRMDNIFGQPYWVGGFLNWDNRADPTGFGIGVNSWKFGSLSVKTDIWHYSSSIMREIQQDQMRISISDRQISWMPEVTIIYSGGFGGGGKPDKSEKLSASFQGFFTKIRLLEESEQDAQYSLRYDRNDFTIEAIRTFRDPSRVSYLTRLSQEPGPYCLSLRKSFDVYGQKFGLGGYWNFDEKLRTQRGKLYVSASGPLNYETWNNRSNDETGYVFKTMSDLSFSRTSSGDAYQNENFLTTTGSVQLGANVGSFYLGLTGDFFLSGISENKLLGRFSPLAIEAEHFVALDSESFISGIHYGLRRGKPTIGYTLYSQDPDQFYMDVTGWLISPDDQIMPAAQLSTAFRLPLVEDVFLNINPTLIYSRQGGAFSGSLSLLYKNFGLELAKPFDWQDNVAYEMGHLSYPYYYRIGPRFDFQGFSGGAYYGQDYDGNPLLGFRIGYGINAKQDFSTGRKNPKRVDAWESSGINPPPEKEQPKDDAMATSLVSPLLRAVLFSGEMSGAENLWQAFKRKVSPLEAVVHLYASGDEQEVFSEISQELRFLKPEQIVYLTLDVIDQNGIHHIAAVNKCQIFTRNNFDILVKTLEGKPEKLDMHLFHVELFYRFEDSSFLLGPFSFRQRFFGKDLRYNGFGTAIFKNLADFLKKHYPAKEIATFDISSDGWTERKFAQYFNVIDVSEVFKDVKQVVASLDDPKDFIKTKGGIDFRYFDSEIILPHVANEEIPVLIDFSIEHFQGFDFQIIQMIPVLNFSSYIFTASENNERLALWE